MVVSPALARQTALVGDEQLGADESELAGSDADVPGLLDGADNGVDRHHGVLAVDRGVEGAPIGGRTSDPR